MRAREQSDTHAAQLYPWDLAVGSASGRPSIWEEHSPAGASNSTLQTLQTRRRESATQLPSSRAARRYVAVVIAKGRLEQWRTGSYVWAERFTSDHDHCAGIDPELRTSVAKEDSAARSSRAGPGRQIGVLASHIPGVGLVELEFSRANAASILITWESLQSTTATDCSGRRSCTTNSSTTGCMHVSCNRPLVAFRCPGHHVCCGIEWSCALNRHRAYPC